MTVADPSSNHPSVGGMSDDAASKSRDKTAAVGGRMHDATAKSKAVNKFEEFRESARSE